MSQPQIKRTNSRKTGKMRAIASRESSNFLFLMGFAARLRRLLLVVEATSSHVRHHRPSQNRLRSPPFTRRARSQSSAPDGVCGCFDSGRRTTPSTRPWKEAPREEQARRICAADVGGIPAEAAERARGRTSSNQSHTIIHAAPAAAAAGEVSAGADGVRTTPG